MRIDCNEAAQFIRGCDNVLILAHANPDGDTVGSCFALCRSLRLAGKKANVSCSDELPARYSYIMDWYSPEDFGIQTVIACDVADAALLGEANSRYAECTDLCIDHHLSNTGYAKRLLLGENSAAACEVIYTLLKTAGLPIDDLTATCIYTGMATDTGCFRFENVTRETHLIAAELHDHNIPFAHINRQLFDIKSRARLRIENLVMSQIELFCGGKCAIAAVTLDMAQKEGISIDEFEGIATLPMQLEGVEIGITLREKDPGKYKVSVRTADFADASKMCAEFGGGGHLRAAGCRLNGDIADVKRRLAEAAQEALSYEGN